MELAGTPTIAHRGQDCDADGGGALGQVEFTQGVLGVLGRFTLSGGWTKLRPSNRPILRRRKEP